MSKISVIRHAYNASGSSSMASRTYGIGIFYNSSESRALAYKSLLQPHSISRAFLVEFDGGANENKILNLSKNRNALREIAEELEVLKFDSIFCYQQNLNRIAYEIKSSLLKIADKSILIDATGAPLIYSVALLKYIFRLFPIPDISIINASGIYASRGEEQFSEGEQFDMYIPGFYGSPDHSLPRHYVFLLGYDGERSLNIYIDNLPEKVSVIIPSPGYDIGNDQSTIRNNRDFLREIGLSNSELEGNNKIRGVYRIDISDVAAVMKRIETIYKRDKGKFEIRLVPLGPKPHAIGAALAAIYNNISIMYQVPKKYYMSEVPVGDKVWMYDLKVEN